MSEPTDAYTLAYHDAHLDPMNHEKWASLGREAVALKDASTGDDATRWHDTACFAFAHASVARDGINPTSEEGQRLVLERV